MIYDSPTFLLDLHQAVMASKKKTTSTLNAALVPVPTAGEADPTKRSHPLDVRSTISNPSSQDPTIILVAVPSNTPIPDAKNRLADPTEELKTNISDITDALPYLIASISH